MGTPPNSLAVVESKKTQKSPEMGEPNSLVVVLGGDGEVGGGVRFEGEGAEQHTGGVKCERGGTHLPHTAQACEYCVPVDNEWDAGIGLGPRSYTQ